VEIRKVGNSGLAVSVLGLGCNNFGMRIGPEETAAVVDAAVDAGITLFDTAEMYGGGKSEEFLGAALAKSGKRDSVILASKFGRAGQGGSRAEIIRSCERSLERLGTDYIDLYYQHYVDRTTPIEETLAALTTLVEQGKVRYLGSSNVDSWHVAEADHTARERRLERFVACQMEWSVLNRAIEAEVVPVCRRYGLGLISYFPLASGLLSGKYNDGVPADSRLATPGYEWLGDAIAGAEGRAKLARVRRLVAIAADLGLAPAQMALAWCLKNPDVSTVMLGATKPQQLRENLGALAAVAKLDGGVMQAIERALG